MPGFPLDRRFARFVLVGGAVAALFLVACYLLAAQGLPPFWASLAAYGLAFVTGYLAQRHWTFGARHRHRHALPRYMAVQAGCALGCALVAQASVDLLGLSPALMAVVATGFAGLASFILSLIWVFPDGRGG